MAGAPRTRKLRMASHKVSRSVMRRIRTSPGSTVWSISSTAPSRYPTVSTMFRLRIVQFRQEPRESADGKAHHIIEAAADLLDQERTQTLDRVRAGLVHALAGLDVALQPCIVPVCEPHFGALGGGGHAMRPPVQE